jgi:Flp pilus assembly protein TadB
VTAHGRITGWIAALHPLASVLCFVVPDYMQMLISVRLVKMLIGAGVMQITGTLIIRKLVNVPY